MFYEKYLIENNMTNKEKKKSFLSKLNIFSKKAKKEEATETVYEENIDDEEFIDEENENYEPLQKKKKISTPVLALMIFMTIFLIIFGAKAYKQYSAQKETQITKEDLEKFKKIEQPKEQPETNKTIKQVEKITRKENNINNEKREIKSYLLGQEKGVMFKNGEVVLLLSGTTVKKGESVYKNYVVSKISIKREKGSHDIDKALFSFEISKNGVHITTLTLDFKDSYKLKYYYEGVQLISKIDTILKTDIVFVGEEIKPNFIFKDFEDKGEESLFKFDLFGMEFEKVLPTESLE